MKSDALSHQGKSLGQNVPKSEDNRTTAKISITSYVQTTRWITEVSAPADTMSEQMLLSRLLCLSFTEWRNSLNRTKADAIEQVVMLELRRMAEFLVADEEAFAELLAQKTDKELLREKNHDEEELQKAIVRNDTVSNLYEKLYEDNAIGKVSDEWFMQLSHKYEVERLELKEKIKVLRQKLSECGQCERDRETFTSAIRRFMRMDRLTAPLLRELIDHIDVFETEGTGKSRTQRIVIYYRFVGYVEIPEVSQKPRIKADTRKGVAVEYLTEPLPA